MWSWAAGALWELGGGYVMERDENIRKDMN